LPLDYPSFHALPFFIPLILASLENKHLTITIAMVCFFFSFFATLYWCFFFFFDFRLPRPYFPLFERSKAIKSARLIFLLLFLPTVSNDFADNFAFFFVSATCDLTPVCVECVLFYFPFSNSSCFKDYCFLHFAFSHLRATSPLLMPRSVV